MDLEELGLSRNEIKVFAVLLRYNSLSAMQASKESGASYGRIYEILGSLEQKGLVKILPSKTKQFAASNPQVLKDMIKAKQQKLKNLDKDVSELKKIYQNKVKEPVLIGKGQANFYKMLKELKSPRKEKLTIKYNLEYDLHWVRDDKILLKKGISIKNLSRLDDETKKNFEKWSKTQLNIRPIVNKGVSISLRDREEFLVSLIDSNTTVVIKDKSFCEVMGVLIEFYYDNH